MMPLRLPCPYLGAEVEWTEERQRRVVERHPELLPSHQQKVAETLASPDLVRRSLRSNRAKLFPRWYTELPGGKHVVVAVMTEQQKENCSWIITAYLTGRLAEGDAEWKRN